MILTGTETVVFATNNDGLIFFKIYTESEHKDALDKFAELSEASKNCDLNYAMMHIKDFYSRFLNAY
ncbi:MAG: hypothetical protein KDD49_03945 [Bacteroidetes bacterium]|nr:hypothetical protein [Bacteroidota bacterium]